MRNTHEAVGISCHFSIQKSYLKTCFLDIVVFSCVKHNTYEF